MDRADVDTNCNVGDKSQGSCCTPSATHHPPPSADGEAAKDLRQSSVSEHTLARMLTLPGGTFLMGTEDPQANLQDGEGPVRKVTLDSFLIDRHPVAGRLDSGLDERSPYHLLFTRRIQNLGITRPGGFFYSVYTIDWRVVDETRQRVAYALPIRGKARIM